MRYEVFDEKDSGIVRLKLSITDFGAVRVEAVDAKGNNISGGHLLQLTLSGKLRRTRYVNPGLGFELDDEGRIKLEE